jgi:hypothetical protein
MANSVWALSDDLMVEHMIACGQNNAKLWLFHLLETLPHEQFIQLTITLWAIWSARRKAIHEDIFQSPLSTHEFIGRFISELKELSKPLVVGGVQARVYRMLLQPGHHRPQPWRS